MPNKNTFKVDAIRNIIVSNLIDCKIILDPFANEQSIKKWFKDQNYISNDLDNEHKCDYNLEAQEFLSMFGDNSVDAVLFDPPYSGRQVAECYKKLGRTVTMNDTNSGYFTKFKKEISRIVKPGGIVITCCWNSNGIGLKYGFDIKEILIVAHGGQHNDTIVTVEEKRQSLF